MQTIINIVVALLLLVAVLLIAAVVLGALCWLGFGVFMALVTVSDRWRTRRRPDKPDGDDLLASLTRDTWLPGSALHINPPTDEPDEAAPATPDRPPVVTGRAAVPGRERKLCNPRFAAHLAELGARR